MKFYICSYLLSLYYYLISLQTMFINKQRIITNTILSHHTSYYFSISHYAKHILNSQFHQQGKTMPGITRGRLNNSNIPIQTIKKLQDQLESNRRLLPSFLNANQLNHLSQNNKQSLSQYIQIYQKLIKTVDPLPITNNYVCSIIAWYNLVDNYKKLFIRLLQSQNQEIKTLLQYLSWMHYQWSNDYGVIDADISLGQTIKNFYRKIWNIDFGIKELQRLQGVVVGPVYYEKRKLYQLYLNRHAQQIFGSVGLSESKMDQCVWLMQTYTKSMNDDDLVFSIMQQCLLKNKQKITLPSIEKLLNIYQLKGSISKPIYQQIIKPFIYRHKMGLMSDVIETIKFAICSECQDNQLLKVLYQLIQNLYSKNKMAQMSRHLYILHMYTHYLLIKGYRIRLNQTLQENMTTFCRQRAQSRHNLSHLIANNSQKAQKYISPCLVSVSPPIKQHQQTKQSKFESQFLTKLHKIPLDDHIFHHKPVLCCFQLDFCLQNKQTHQIHDIQIQGLQYVFKSGKFIRERQIRDQILKHYDIQVHHVDFTFIRNKEYSSLEDFFRRAPKKE